jgi:hypothetical protein
MDKDDNLLTIVGRRNVMIESPLIQEIVAESKHLNRPPVDVQVKRGYTLEVRSDRLSPPW